MDPIEIVQLMTTVVIVLLVAAGMLLRNFLNKKLTEAKKAMQEELTQELAATKTEMKAKFNQEIAAAMVAMRNEGVRQVTAAEARMREEFDGKLEAAKAAMKNVFTTEFSHLLLARLQQAATGSSDPDDNQHDAVREMLEKMTLEGAMKAHANTIAQLHGYIMAIRGYLQGQGINLDALALQLAANELGTDMPKKTDQGELPDSVGVPSDDDEQRLATVVEIGTQPELRATG